MEEKGQEQHGNSRGVASLSPSQYGGGGGGAAETAAGPGGREEKMQKQQEFEDRDRGEEEDELVGKEGEVILRLFDHQHHHQQEDRDGTGSSRCMEIAVPRQVLASRIPYFATLFSDPWNASTTTPNKDTAPAGLVEHPNRPPVVQLQCSPLSSCEAYYRFFELLKSAMADGHIWPFPRGMLGSISEAVELLPVADHLLFQECLEVCMQYLAGRPWSVEDEALIRGTLLPCFSRNITAAINPDLQARLDSGSNMGLVFERTFIFLLSPRNGSKYPPEFFRTCLISGRSKRGILSLLMRIWVAETPRVCEETSYLPNSWMDLTLSLLEHHPNAQIVVEEFAEKPHILAMYKRFDIYRRNVMNGLLIQVFKHASSGNIPLSNSQCLALLKMWDGYTQHCADHALSQAFLDVYKRLPLNDNAVLDFAYTEAKRFAYLSSQLLSYIDRSDILMIDTTNSPEGKAGCADA